MKDPALFKSEFDRIEGDRYFTEHWVTRALLDTFPMLAGMTPFYEPFVGRGDIAYVISRRWPGVTIHGNDINPVDFYAYSALRGFPSTYDFFDDEAPHPVGVSVITNPPYDRAGEAVERCLQAMDGGDVKFVAMLLRSEFDHAAKRTHLFTRPDYMGKLILTSRPRWDAWWNTEAPKASPRHNFAWFLWNANWRSAPQMWWAGKR